MGEAVDHPWPFKEAVVKNLVFNDFERERVGVEQYRDPICNLFCFHTLCLYSYTFIFKRHLYAGGLPHLCIWPWPFTKSHTLDPPTSLVSLQVWLLGILHLTWPKYSLTFPQLNTSILLVPKPKIHELSLCLLFPTPLISNLRLCWICLPNVPNVSTSSPQWPRRQVQKHFGVFSFFKKHVKTHPK